jgi:glycosyltransferase involved in cell wall biosynthesis
MKGRKAIVLPRKEAFARDRSGAIALSVEAYVRQSRHRDATTILGMPVKAPRDPDTFHPVTPRDVWWRRRNLTFAAACADYLATAPARHIEVHNRIETFFVLAERFPRAAMTLWLHNDPHEMRGARSVRERQRILDRARWVLCLSDWIRNRFLDGIPVGADRVLVFPSGLDMTGIGMAPKDQLILYVGRVIPDKGVLPLAEALAQTLPDLPAWRAAIVGAARRPGTRYEKDVAATLAPLGKRIAIPGFLPHERIMTEFARAAIAVVPSQWDEPFGRTALEAMAAGCAVIASQRGGMPEILGDAGILIDTPDAASLAAAIATLARDDAQRATLQGRGRARAAAAFDIRRWAARLDELYD